MEIPSGDPSMPPTRYNGLEREYVEVISFCKLCVSRYIEGGPPPGEADHSCSLWRRYSEFELLRNYLVAMFPAVSTK